ncbi:MAG TPA: hypothetical protein VED63_04720, partial [Acidimicrobiales bacterium]|nr:hypothetical protein [Acidimicrobiales bacterium]
SSGRPAMAGQEVLDEDERALEALVLAVRTAEGVPEWAVADDPELRTLVHRRHGRAVLTLRGRLLADEVARRLRVPSILPA